MPVSYTHLYSFLWFVPAIITFYILVPIFYAVFKRAKNKYIFILAVLEIWLLVSLLLKAYMREDLYGFTNRIPIFIMGVFLGWICREKTVHFNKTTWIFLIITLILGLYLAYQSNICLLYTSSKVIVTDDYVKYLRYFPLRPEQRVIQLWHCLLYTSNILLYV